MCTNTWPMRLILILTLFWDMRDWSLSLHPLGWVGGRVPCCTGCQSVTDITSRRTNTSTLTFTPLGNSECPFLLTFMSLDCDWKLELPEETQKNGRTCKLHRERPDVIKYRSCTFPNTETFPDHTTTACNQEVFW